MKSIRCMFGYHKWSYNKGSDTIRICQRCQNKQILEMSELPFRWKDE